MKTATQIVYQSKVVYICGVLVAVAGAYATGSWAIDSASMWAYAATLVLLGAGVWCMVRVVRRT